MMKALGGLFLLFCLTAIWASAQTGSGSIQGTVKDSSGAVVPNAKVTIVHTATNGQFNGETNEVGFYLFPSLQIGAYEITVESAGMETWKGQLSLQSGQVAVVDPALKLATAATAVTVAGDVTPLVTTTSPTVATVIERQRIEQLPINGRFVTTLLYQTTPGVESGSVPRNYGLRYASELLQDGAVLSNREWGSIPARQPGLDTIGELRSETTNSSAKMNRPATFYLTTRSGTNDFHGSLFETHRNSGLGVARSRTDYYTKPPHLVRNEFGVSAGGPVYIPKLYNGRNKTFFFFAYEGYRLMQSSTRSIAVPTEAMRNGDFSGLVDGQGRLTRIYDPNTTQSAADNWARTPFPENKIPLARQSPLAKYLYSITPTPTQADNPLIGPNWFGTGFNVTRQHTETAKVDHRINDNNSLSFRYSHSPASSSLTSSPYGQSPTTLDRRANAYIDEGQNDNGVANWTHTFSPTFFWETLVTVSRDYRGQIPYTRGEEISSTLGLPNPFNGVGFPRIPYTMTTATGSAMSYDSSINLTINYAKIFNFDQNFTKIKGRHEFQFGGRFRYELIETLEDVQIQQGQLSFNDVGNTGLYDPTSGSSYSSAPFAGSVAANLFLGIGAYNAQFNRSWYPLSNNEKSLYFQDNFKVNSRLTLNLGVRYEYNSPFNVRDNSLLGFDPKQKAVILPQSIEALGAQGNLLPSIAYAYQNLGVKYITPEQAGLPKSLVHSNYYDFGPRLGFAYRLGSGNRTTVVRGGYSIFAYSESLRLLQGNAYSTLPTRGIVQYNPNLAELSPDGLPNYLMRSVPTVIAGVNSSNILPVDRPVGITRGGAAVNYADPDQPTARAHEWSFLVEREVFANTVVKTGFVGTHGSRIAQYYSYNNNPPAYVWYTTTGLPFPTGEYASVARRPFENTVYGTIQSFQKSGWSNNVSYQVELEHRYSKGYAFQAFYVMSNAQRVAGDGWRDDTLVDVNQYLPGTVPEDQNARNRLLFYRRDSAIPKHRFNWNFLVDLPFGKGKPFGRGSGRLVDALIGGWQVAGYGSLISRYFQIPTGNIANQSNYEYYGKKYPIQDCRTGVCYDGWLMWNGYIPANRINSYDANGKPNGVMGVPSTYKPIGTPLWPTPANGGSPSDPMFPFYETNTVYVPLKDGSLQRTTLGGFVDPMINQYKLGPMLWNMSASAFKSVKLTEQVILRFNADFLQNVFNMPGQTLPGGDGVATTRSSANSPRVLQLTLRLSW
ncbi:MAG TPA: carboxypeptidase regulatory-like domain-containing protein [Bryobacteraceae bacterium]|nr:carboxypeptidase regulatory-like domain-containing protein [Bryobacteraceae bacterium]